MLGTVQCLGQIQYKRVKKIRDNNSTASQSCWALSSVSCRFNTNAFKKIKTITSQHRSHVEHCPVSVADPIPFKFVTITAYNLVIVGYRPLSQVIFFCEGPRSRCYGRIAALRIIVHPVMKMISFSPFFRLMKHRWNEIDRENPKCSRKNLSQCHFVHHKSHTDWPGIEPGPPR
jgi:hypothetical protein